MRDRRINDKLAYHVKEAFPEKDRRSEILADRRVHRGRFSILRALMCLPVKEIWSRLILRKK